MLLWRRARTPAESVQGACGVHMVPPAKMKVPVSANVATAASRSPRLTASKYALRTATRSDGPTCCAYAAGAPRCPHGSAPRTDTAARAAASRGAGCRLVTAVIAVPPRVLDPGTRAAARDSGRSGRSAGATGSSQGPPRRRPSAAGRRGPRSPLGCGRPAFRTIGRPAPRAQGLLPHPFPYTSPILPLILPRLMSHDGRPTGGERGAAGGGARPTAGVGVPEGGGPGGFGEQVRDALAHLYDPVALRRHPLAGALAPPPGAARAADAGRALRQRLLDAI